MIELARFFLGIALLLVAYLLACGLNALGEALVRRGQKNWANDAQGEPGCITPWPTAAGPVLVPPSCEQKEGK